MKQSCHTQTQYLKTTFYENKNLQTQTKIRIRTVGKSQTTQGISKGAEY
jgi:hypothetical protein